MNTATILGGIHSITHFLKLTSLNDIWLQNVILVVTAIIALVTFSTTSRQEKRRATFDIVRDMQKDASLIEARALMRKTLGNGPLNVTAILQPKDSAEQQAIFTILNSYEFVATGVSTGAFDVKTYKCMYCNNVVTTWATYKDFVVEYRKRYREEYKGVPGMQSKTLFKDFEALAKKWKKRRAERAHPAASAMPAATATQAAIAAQAPGTAPATTNPAASQEHKQQAQ